MSLREVGGRGGRTDSNKYVRVELGNFFSRGSNELVDVIVRRAKVFRLSHDGDIEVKRGVRGGGRGKEGKINNLFEQARAIFMGA